MVKSIVVKKLQGLLSLRGLSLAARTTSSHSISLHVSTFFLLCGVSVGAVSSFQSVGVGNHVGCKDFHGVSADDLFLSAGGGDENVEHARYDESKANHHHNEMGNDKTDNVERVVGVTRKLRVGETRDDGKHRRRDIADQKTMADWQGPVLAVGNVVVEVVTELVALYPC